MADEEAAFLASMHSMNEKANNYGAEDAVRSLQADSNSSDEYDPAQAVPTLLPSSAPAPDPSVQKASVVDAPYSGSLSSAPNVSLKPNPGPAVPDLENTPGPERQSESRSMSRTSSSASSSLHIIEMNSASKSPLEGNVKLPDDGQQKGEGEADSREPMPLPQASVAAVADQNSTSPVLLANDVKSEDIQNVFSQSVPNLAAVIPDTGAAVHSEPTAKPAETLPVPTAAPPSPPKEQPAAIAPPQPKARLPNDIVGMLEDRIKEDPKGDTKAWLSLIEEHKNRSKLEDARATYERFLAVFPSAAEQWVAFATMEQDAQNRDGLERIFQRNLMQTPYLPLWSKYLDHIQRLNNLTTDASGQARQTIHQAYDLALRQVGLDKDSGKLWQDYVTFIKSGPGIIGGSGWQDQQKMDLLRKTYQRAICVPTQSTNVLWKEYDGFEMGLNKMTGRKFLQDQSPSYMSARSSYTELQNIIKTLRRTTIPVLPPVLGCEGDVDYVEQLNLWKRWVQWEKDDPLVLKQEDIAAYRARVLFVYKHALMAMRFWPELWCDASDFCFSNEMENEGNDFLIQGIAANPESCLLAFRRADRIELTTTNEEGEEGATRRGAAVREPLDKVLDALYDLIATYKTREEKDLSRIEAHFAAAANKQPNGTNEEDEEEPQEDEGVNKAEQKAAQIDATKKIYAVHIRLIAKTLTHVWIAVLRTMRRTQGQDGFRGAFGQARKRGRILPDAYVAAALIEFHCYEPKTATRIFERGLKLFQEDEGFTLEYLKHLVAINDHTNARVVFETAVTRLAQKPETIQKTKPLYAFFHDFESRYGELTQIVKLEKRMRDLFPEDPSLLLFKQRFADGGFDPTAIRPIVSPLTQTRPRTIPTIETVPPSQQTPPIQSRNSPKRALPLDDSDNEQGRPRKIVRAESPLKGAAGRRLDQQKRIPQTTETPLYSQSHMPLQPLPPPLPRDVTFLLSIIPKPGTYHATKFKPEELVRLIRETNVPTNISQLPQSQPPAGRGGPPPPQAQHMAPHIQHPPQPVQQRPPMPQLMPQPMPQLMPQLMPQPMAQPLLQPMQQPMPYGQYNVPYNGPAPYVYSR